MGLGEEKHSPCSILFAPLTIKGFIVGTLGLANIPAFSDDDTQLATAFAELTAIAVLDSQTTELLESSEHHFHTLVQSTFAGIVISEGEFIREANEQFARIHGCTQPNPDSATCAGSHSPILDFDKTYTDIELLADPSPILRKPSASTIEL
jgi:hypothetical protein